MKGVGGGPQKAKQVEGPKPASGADGNVEFKSIKDIAAAFNNPIPTNPHAAITTTSTTSTTLTTSSTSTSLSTITGSIKDAVLSITPFTKDTHQKDNKEKEKDKDNKDKEKDNKDKDKEGRDKLPNTTKAGDTTGRQRVIGGKEPSSHQINTKYVIPRRKI